MVTRSFNKDLEDELLSFIKREMLIPIIGSGFTVGCKANNGKVPSGQEMKEYMMGKLIETLDEDIKGDFSKIANAYDRHIDKKIRNKYLKDNFTNVLLEEEKKEFLDVSWPYIYSLNIDDAVENNLQNYDVILANKNVDIDYIKNNKCIFKLHGDANDVLKYKDSDQKIFTKKEYLKSLQSNICLLDLFKNDYMSKSLIFIGCSLDDEIDLLSSIIDINHINHYKRKIYYMTHEELGAIKKGELEDFGITDIIKINDVNDYLRIYSEFKKLHRESLKVKKSELENFKNLNIKEDDSYLKNDNMVYLFESNKITNNKLPDNKLNITIPKFFITRDASKKIVDNIDEFTIHMLEGDRVSGKSYCLIDILRRIKDRDTFYLASEISLNNQAFEKLLCSKKAVIIFDSNSITNEQIKYIIDKNIKIKENDTRIIFAINTSNKDIIAELKIRMSTNKDLINRVSLDSKFSKTEIKEINHKLSLLNIEVFDNKKTILDNIIRIDKIIRDRNEILPNFRMPKLKNIEKEDLIIMIILATKEKISSYDITVFNLIESIAKFENLTAPATQFTYVGLYEENNHSGYKVIANAKYWLLGTLGEYSLNYKNEIADAYKSIANSLKMRYKEEKKFFKEMAKYINFDVLNSIFYQKENGGAAGLIRRIYEKLHDDLCNDPQYFHQRAKSIYWLRRTDKSQLEEALHLVDKSLNDIEATKDITSEYTKNSISHVEYTKALIVGRLCTLNDFKNIELNKTAIKCYYKAFTNPRNSEYTNDLKKRKTDYKLTDLKTVLEKTRKDNAIKGELKYEINKLYEILIK